MVKNIFDTGSRENTVLNNAKELKIDLNGIENVYLSHNHKDHTGGLINLKKTTQILFQQLMLEKEFFILDLLTKQTKIIFY